MPKLTTISSWISFAAVTYFIRLFREMFQIAKFVIIKPIRVELGALMVWDLFQPSILAIFSAFNGSSPVSYHLLHLHFCLYTVTS